MSRRIKKWRDDQFHEDIFNLNCTISTEEIRFLNFDCLVRIFEYLSIVDRIRFERVSKLWRIASRESWRTFKYFKPTKDIWGNLENCEIDVQAMKKILNLCGQFVTHLNLSSELQEKHLIKIKTFNAIVKPLGMCPNLTSVDLTLIELGTTDIRVLAQNCKNITELSIGPVSKCVNDKFMSETVFTKFRKLRYLKIKYATTITGIFFNNISETIEEIHLEHCYRLNLWCFGTNIVNFRNLRTICLYDSIPARYTYFEFNNLGLENVREINIAENQEAIEDRCIEDLNGSWNNITSINLKGNVALSNVAISIITALPNLQHLNISELSKITDEALEIMPQLKTLDCSYTKITDNALIKLLQTSKFVEILDCSNCKNVSGKLMKSALEIVNTRLNNVHLRIIAKSNNMNLEIFENMRRICVEL